MTSLKELARRWDIDPPERSPMPFADGIALLNVKRIKLVCLLGALNDVIELAVGHWRPQLWIDLLLIPVLLAIATHSSAAAARARRATVAIFIVGALLITQWAVFKVANRGFVAPGFLIRLLTITLLFVLSPRTLAALLALLFATYGAMMLNTPLSAYWKVEAMVNAGYLHAGLANVGLAHLLRPADRPQATAADRVAEHPARSPERRLDQFRARPAQPPLRPAQPVRPGVSTRSAGARVAGPRAAGRHRQPRRDDRAGDALAAGAPGRARPAGGGRGRRPSRAPAGSGSADRASGRSAGRHDRARHAGRPAPGALRWRRAGADPRQPACQRRALHARRAAAAPGRPCGGRPGHCRGGRQRGPGIDPVLRPVLFRKFHRGTHAHEATDAAIRGAGGKAGSGMGLFIAATYAARLSFRPGEPSGAVFELSLRAAKQD